MKTTTTFYVVRHGESEANKNAIVSDWRIDYALTEKGVKQACYAANNLKMTPLDLIMSSTRQRAFLTAQQINVFHQLLCLTSGPLGHIC